MIKVCDAIMGSGKSSAAINYMNSRPRERFIYITPYLDEARRIQEACPALHFKEPSNRLPEFGFRKYLHTLELIRSGENITSTHNMFLRYTDDMIDLIKDGGYTLIIDEAVDILREASISSSDIKLLESAGWLKNDGRSFSVQPGFDYDGGAFTDMVSLAKGNRLIYQEDAGSKEHLLYWSFSHEIFLAFKEVFVLTYLFEAQTMKCYFDLYGLSYEKIGIHRDKGGGYHFCDRPEYLPAYTEIISSKIHILEDDKLNSIGDRKTDLSHGWFERSTHREKREKLKKNVYNYFMNLHRGEPADKRLWATYKSAVSDLRQKGYYRSNIAFNIKATNNYKGCNVLAYCVNIFMQPNFKRYLVSQGVDVREEEYALSVMLQWIWRSAIRDGQEIWIYVPSKRMRNLLHKWIKDVESNYKQYKKEVVENDLQDERQTKKDRD